MAGAGRRTFQPGEVLTASNVNSYLMDQSVMRFASSAARGSAIGTAVIAEGMVSYLDDTDQLSIYDGSAWSPLKIASGGTGGTALAQAQSNLSIRILQVVSTAKTNTFTTTSTSFTDITGLSVSITPSSTSSKILVFGVLSGSNDVAVAGGTSRLMRGSTAIDIGDAAGSRDRVTINLYLNDANHFLSQPFSFLDSPATTSAVTYKLQIRTHAGTIYVNRSKNDTDTGNFPRGVSSITVMEVLG